MQHRPTVAKIDLDALAHNFHETRRFVGERLRYMAVVKADAYGHGAVDCARRLEAEGIDWFGVAITEEGVELREAGITRPILCLGSFWPGQEDVVISHQLTPVIFEMEVAAVLSSAVGKGSYDIHVKIDTGMGRVGVRWPDTAEFARGLKSFTNLNVTGIMTHLASAIRNHADRQMSSTLLRSCRRSPPTQRNSSSPPSGRGRKTHQPSGCLGRNL